ncbi:MAG: hypothetical protein RLZZ429_1501 [Bacteroidota bacterium]
MAEIKTKVGKENITDFLNTITPEQKKKDAFQLLELFQKITGLTPQLWGGAIVGFGKYDYQQKGGQKGEWFLAGFAPRKSNISIYTMAGFEPYESLLKQLGKHKTGMGCLYINKLADVDLKILEKIALSSFEEMKKKSTTLVRY